MHSFITMPWPLWAEMRTSASAGIMSTRPQRSGRAAGRCLDAALFCEACLALVKRVERTSSRVAKQHHILGAVFFFQNANARADVEDDVLVDCGGVVVWVAAIGGEASDPGFEESWDRVVTAEVDAWMHQHRGDAGAWIALRSPIEPSKLSQVRRMKTQGSDLRVFGLLLEEERGAQPVRLRNEGHRAYEAFVRSSRV